MLRRICFRSPPRLLLGRLLRTLSSASPSNPSDQNRQKSSAGDGSLAEMAMSNPWPEWVELMERFLQKGYLTSSRKDSNHIRTACINFARDRSHLFHIGNGGSGKSVHHLSDEHLVRGFMKIFRKWKIGNMRAFNLDDDGDGAFPIAFTWL